MKKFVLFIMLMMVCFHMDAQLLWKISGNKVKKPSYIFGTHHLAPLSICDTIKGFNDAFNSCNTLYGEILMTDMDALSEQLIPYMMLPEDTYLENLYSEADYGIINELIKNQLGFTAEQIKNLKPTAITAQLQAIQGVRTFTDFDPKMQIDETMQRRAKKKGMKVVGLESVSYQARLLYNIPIDEQAEDLLKLANNFERSDSVTGELCNLYMKQDIDKFFDITRDPDFGMDDDLLDRLVYGRNRMWVSILRTIIPDNPTFIVVGAEHLAGDKGVIELLRRQGYTVTAVK